MIVPVRHANICIRFVKVRRTTRVIELNTDPGRCAQLVIDTEAKVEPPITGRQVSTLCDNTTGIGASA